MLEFIFEHLAMVFIAFFYSVMLVVKAYLISDKHMKRPCIKQQFWTHMEMIKKQTIFTSPPFFSLSFGLACGRQGGLGRGRAWGG
jgi:apolipoprotein N-acyltransferase